MSNIVSVNWLQERLNDSGVIVFDATMASLLPSANDTLSVIPGALRFDFGNDICDKNSTLPNTMPNAEYFQQRMRELGVSESTTVVVYDIQGIYSSARAWWMLKSMGHTRVYVLDGGLPAWLASGFPVASDWAEPIGEGDFVAQYDTSDFVDSAAVQAAIEKDGIAIFDARSPKRFSGEDKDPRPNVRAGHIPGSGNLHYEQVLENGHLRNSNQLQQTFNDLNVSGDTNLFFSCGSGVTACILALAATEIGLDKISVYDGSWSDWGSNHELPVELS